MKIYREASMLYLENLTNKNNQFWWGRSEERKSVCINVLLMVSVPYLQLLVTLVFG